MAAARSLSGSSSSGRSASFSATSTRSVNSSRSAPTPAASASARRRASAWLGHARSAAAAAESAPRTSPSRSARSAEASSRWRARSRASALAGSSPRDPLEGGGLPGDVARGGVCRRERLRDPEGLGAAGEEPLEERDRVALLRGPEPAALQDREGELGRLRVAREGLGEQLGAGDLERRSLRAALARREPPEDGRALLGHAGAGDRLERGVQPPQPLVVLLHRQRVAPGVRSPLRLARVEPQPPEPRR